MEDENNDSEQSFESNRRDVLKQVGVAGGASIVGLSATTGHAAASEDPQQVADKYDNPHIYRKAITDHGGDALDFLEARDEAAKREVEATLSELGSAGSVSDVSNAGVYVFTLDSKALNKLERESSVGVLLQIAVRTGDTSALLKVYPVQQRGEVAILSNTQLRDAQLQQDGKPTADRVAAIEAASDVEGYLVPGASDSEGSVQSGDSVTVQSPVDCEKINEKCEDPSSSDCAGCSGPYGYSDRLAVKECCYYSTPYKCYTTTEVIGDCECQHTDCGDDPWWE